MAKYVLGDSEKRLRAVLDNATVSIFFMDQRQQCVYMNKAAEHLTGFTLQEVLARDCPLHDIIHYRYPDGRPFPLSECAIDRAFPERYQVQGEEVFVHKDGTLYPVAFTASPILDERSKAVGTIIEVRDTRDEKAAQERQSLLVNELNHRVKNTLATIQSLAWQTFKDSDREALTLYSSRLDALSRAHNVLTQKSWSNVSFGDVIHAAIEPFGNRIAASGADCEVPSRVAVTTAMVIHELATNATKYGALSVPTGTVSLTWSATDRGQHILIDLTWQEQGGPRVAEPARRGFGSRLIERQAATETGGSARIEFHPDGVRCGLKLLSAKGTG